METRVLHQNQPDQRIGSPNESPSHQSPDGQCSGEPDDVLVPTRASAPERRSSLKPVLVEILQTVLLTLVIFAAVRTVVQNFKVDGASMEPTLHDGQYLLIDKISYLRLEGLPLQIAQRLGIYSQAESSVFPFGGPQRGDVVVFRYPANPQKDFIKRIIGLPGDMIWIDRGRVYVNGTMLQEDYISALPQYSVPPERVPDGNYFVLGDNRPNSSDSHFWGFVPQANLIGKAWLIYWPPSQWGVVPNRVLAGSQR